MKAVFGRTAGFFRKVIAPRTTKVGWFMTAEEAGFIWEGPAPSKTENEPPRSSKSVLMCPAVIDFEARQYEIKCPIDLHLRLARDQSGRLVLKNGAGSETTINTPKLAKLAALTPEENWRHGRRPIVQIMTPYRFISDELVYLSQLPPLQHYRPQPLPGILIGGRFPIDAWPRPLTWAFEWHDPAQDIVVRRGEPWFTVHFETTDPRAGIRLVEAELTADLQRQCDGVEGVAGYVNRTFSLLSVARARRPKTLLVERRKR